MTKTMAEVLAEHILLSHERSGTYACSDPNCGWEFRYRLRMDALKSGVDVVLSEFTAHQAAALSAAGYGLVADAQREAWDEGHERGFWNGRMSQLTVPYDAPDPLIGKQDAEANNPYRKASNDDH